jgi:hypothetical protein
MYWPFQAKFGLGNLYDCAVCSGAGDHHLNRIQESKL